MKEKDNDRVKKGHADTSVGQRLGRQIERRRPMACRRWCSLHAVFQQAVILGRWRIQILGRHRHENDRKD